MPINLNGLNENELRKVQSVLTAFKNAGININDQTLCDYIVNLAVNSSSRVIGGVCTLIKNKAIIDIATLNKFLPFIKKAAQNATYEDSELIANLSSKSASDMGGTYINHSTFSIVIGAMVRHYNHPNCEKAFSCICRKIDYHYIFHVISVLDYQDFMNNVSAINEFDRLVSKLKIDDPDAWSSKEYREFRRFCDYYEELDKQRKSKDNVKKLSSDINNMFK